MFDRKAKIRARRGEEGREVITEIVKSRGGGKSSSTTRGGKDYLDLGKKA